MSIEASTPSPAPRTGSAGESRNVKSSGRGQSSDASPQGFLAALSAVDEVTEAPLPVTAQDLVTNEPPAPVDIAPAATDLIASFMQLPTPVEFDSTMQLPSASMAGAAFNPTAAAVGPKQSGLQTSPKADLQSAQSLGADVRSEGATAKEGVAMRSYKAQGGALAVNASVTDAMKEHDVKFLAALEAMKTVQVAREPASQGANIPAIAASVGSLMGDRYLRRDSASDASNAAQPAGTGVPVFGDSLSGEVAAAVPAGQVAEQVAFWISTDVHKAELKLDGLGEDAVEVSIRMSGNEAHVTFRTDEAQARGALEGAADHLKELLQREGLVLSGVSVGSSGSGDAGAQQRQQQQPARQITTVAVPVSGLERGRPANGVAGRTLDLFV